MRKIMLSMVGVSIVTGATLTAQPAYAADQLSCVILDGAYGCYTNYVDRSSRITVRTRASSYGPVTCYAYDPGGNLRGQVTASTPTPRTESFSVPFNQHFLSCVRSRTNGGGGGSIYNW